MTVPTLQIQAGLKMSDINAFDWNPLVVGKSPFVQHEFLLALELSGSVGEGTGWIPHHVCVFENKKLLAAMPLYIKHHSYGEYVFDWGWADAWRRYQMPYYPKLVSAIPFTPSQSPRLLATDNKTAQRVITPVLQTIQAQAHERGFSSWHILFPDADTSAALDTVNLVRREAVQYQWYNRHYQSFEDFLSACSSRKRKNLRKERQDIAQQGFSFQRLSGEQLTTQIWDRFYQFYQNTYQVRGQYGYMSREFFSLLHKTMPEQVFLVMALHLPSRCVGRAAAQYADAAKRDEDTWMQTRSKGGSSATASLSSGS